MKKPVLLLRGPVETRSGYGSHSKDILKSLHDMDMFEIWVDSCKWGNTPMNALDENNEFDKWVKSRIIKKLNNEPDIYIQVTVPNEFNRLGKINIGITAGTESNAIPKNWVDGCNRMDAIIVPSTFSKEVLLASVYNEVDNVSGKLIKQYKIEKPVHVLFEGVNTEIYNDKPIANNDITHKLDSIKEDFNFLFVGHWLSGDIGEDRKNVGKLIQCFVEAFKGEENKPGLILKTSSATFSVIQREDIVSKIKTAVGDAVDAPPIYLLFGDLTDDEMNSLYNHDKVKTMVTLTKGEGFGRPLLEFTMTGKPIVASNWSGHKDFLPIDKTLLIGGTLNPVHESAANQFLIKESMWFNANYDEFIAIIKSLRKNYGGFVKHSKGLKVENSKKFSLDKMTEEFKEILSTITHTPKKMDVVIPKLEKL